MELKSSNEFPQTLEKPAFLNPNCFFVQEARKGFFVNP